MLSFFFFNDTATTEIYTLSLHDALPISLRKFLVQIRLLISKIRQCASFKLSCFLPDRSEEHTSELQSHSDLVCRLLLEKKSIKSWPRHYEEVYLEEFEGWQSRVYFLL